MRHVYTLQYGIDLCRVVEPLLSEIGYHCALAGSVLIKGESMKDVDVIAYPHDPEKTQTAAEIIAALSPAGIVGRMTTDDKYTNRRVVVCGHNDHRVDLFVL